MIGLKAVFCLFLQLTASVDFIGNITSSFQDCYNKDQDKFIARVRTRVEQEFFCSCLLYWKFTWVICQEIYQSNQALQNKGQNKVKDNKTRRICTDDFVFRYSLYTVIGLEGHRSRRTKSNRGRKKFGLIFSKFKFCYAIWKDHQVKKLRFNFLIKYNMAL